MPDCKRIGVIPARFGSTRFPGKPLVKILGTSLIQRTYENALQARLIDELVVATDDKRIFDHVESFGGKAVMTSPTAVSGTDRAFETVESHFPDAKIVVNIQGDEPCLNPKIIDALITKLESDPSHQMTTPVTPITNPHDIFAPSAVKCVFDCNGKALYFSRAPIPFPKNTQKIHTYYRHLGVYCFRRSFLKIFHELPTSRLQEIEDLEQLKVLENGYPIHVCIVEESGIGVDTPEDVQRIEEILCQKQELQNTFLSQAGSSPH